MKLLFNNFLYECLNLTIQGGHRIIKIIPTTYGFNPILVINT